VRIQPVSIRSRIPEVSIVSQAVSRPATFARHYEDPPQRVESDGSSTWITRSTHFVIALTGAKEGTSLRRDAGAYAAEEYMLVLPPGVDATVSAGGEAIEAAGDSLTIVPPGASEIVVKNAGTVVRIFSGNAADLMRHAINAQSYDADEPAVQPLPEPPSGYRLRNYELARHVPATNDFIKPRIFRSTNLMVNAFAPWDRPRPTDELRPHWHDDFEQASVGLSGRWIHYLRTPWSADLAEWKADETVSIDSPSVAVIPAKLVHTTRNVGSERAWLIDVFGPPRADFIKAGIILNRDDYPAPEHIAASTIAKSDVPDSWRVATKGD
jgi:hypothetical protein